jgi:U3 small nucleolar RNA-associated protein 15
MAGGLLSIRQRVVKSAEEQTRRAQKEQAHGGTYKYFVRGQKAAAEGDFIVESQKKRRLREYDRYLKVFQYGNALDATAMVFVRRFQEGTTFLWSPWHSS